VKIKSRDADSLFVTLKGGGILLNSGWPTTSVSANPDIVNEFPANAPLKDGSVLSLFCTDTSKPGKARVAYYVAQY